MDLEDAFSKYHISNKWKLLDDIKERTPCPKCKKSRKFFCYSCYIPVPSVRDILPRVSLPIHINIIKHRREIDGKSTSAHAVLLAPDHVSMFQYPVDVCNFVNDDKTILIYPGKNPCTLKQYFHTNPIHIRSINDYSCHKFGEGIILMNNKVLELPFNKVIFVDGTWNQSKAMYGCLKDLPCIVLNSRPSQFWRHQKNSPRWYLATIEAIHQLLTEIYEHCSELVHSNIPRDHDNLLFFFRYMYHLIHSFYDHNTLLSFRRPLNL